ncbi:hypothetical protein MBLNU13_g02951t2 [Cladosporium sp. NU13]
MTEYLTNSRQEGDTGIIKLQAVPSDGESSAEEDDVRDEPEIVKLMVEYFHHFNYLRDTESLSNSAATLSPATGTAGSSSTPKKAKHKLARVRLPPPTDRTQQPPSQISIIEHAKVFAIAVKYQIDGLRDLAASKFKDAASAHWDHDDFVRSIYVTYSSTAKEVTQLREVVAEILHQHCDDIEEDSELETALCNIPRLAYDVLKRSRAKEIDGSTALAGVSYECDECGKKSTGTPGGKSMYGRPVREVTYCPRCW